MDDGSPRRLVDSYLAREHGGGWALREVPPIELFLPPQGPHVVEAGGARDGAPPRGFAVADGAVHDLGGADGLERFLRGPGAALDPLPLILLVAR
jgi:hypothetical protein